MGPPINALDIGLSPARQLHKGWITFVSRYEWQWFCTMTFRDSVHPESADKRFRMFVSKLNRKLFGPRWSSKKRATVYWARGLEYQKRGVLHFHALLACAGKDLNHIAIRRDWEAVWQDLSGYARIEKVRSQKRRFPLCNQIRNQRRSNRPQPKPPRRRNASAGRWIGY